jgi:hypothetical protein
VASDVECVANEHAVAERKRFHVAGPWFYDVLPVFRRSRNAKYEKQQSHKNVQFHGFSSPVERRLDSAEYHPSWEAANNTI